MSESRWGWLASMVIAVGCQGSVPSEADKGERERGPVAKSEVPAKAPEPGEEAIQVTLPEKSSRTDGGASTGSVGSDASISESFGPGGSLQECLSTCETRPLSDDNRATCRLLCRSHHARKGTAEAGELVDAYVGCFDACEGEASCRKRCTVDVGKGEACVTPCFDAFGRCLAPCEGDGEAGRCAERCETTARGCLGAC